MGKARSIDENVLTTYICKNWEIIFPRFTFIEMRPRIFGIVSNKSIGSADILFSINHVYHLAEGMKQLQGLLRSYSLY